jgi:ATP-dependent DNA helicase RecG
VYPQRTDGVLLVGVEDDGTVSGARSRDEAGRTDPLRVQALIAYMTQPALSAVVGIVQTGGAEILVVEVLDSPRVVGTARGTYVRRAIAGDGRPACVLYHAHEMPAHEVGRGGAVDWVGTKAEVTAGALLLFGRSQALRRFLSNHEAAVQVLRGNPSPTPKPGRIVPGEPGRAPQAARWMLAAEQAERRSQDAWAS